MMSLPVIGLMHLSGEQMGCQAKVVQGNAATFKSNPPPIAKISCPAVDWRTV